MFDKHVLFSGFFAIFLDSFGMIYLDTLKLVNERNWRQVVNRPQLGSSLDVNKALYTSKVIWISAIY
jgi:hypothetical protein